MTVNRTRIIPAPITKPHPGKRPPHGGLASSLALLLVVCTGWSPLASHAVAVKQADSSAAEAPNAESEDGPDAEEPMIDQLRPQRIFEQNCVVCHGDRLQGSAQGVALVGVDPIHGSEVSDIVRLVANGVSDKGMPAFANTLSTDDITNVAMYVAEQRLNYNPNEYGVAEPIVISPEEQSSARETFCLRTVAEGLDSAPFSIAHLPDGSMLVTEKTKGLRIVSPNGELGPYIRNTPKVYGDSKMPENLGGLETGYGWMAEVALHPDYSENGWIYLSYGDRCENCNDVSRAANSPVSMTTLVRGRIRDGKWVDQELIWGTDQENYGIFNDMVLGGRITFDDKGHVFLSIGTKGDYIKGIQDIDKPYGKILRVHDDGRIPADNPFVDELGALKSVWSYGHRNPQGLEFDVESGTLWSTEHGPRGGDEVNLIEPGRNYGWPLTSLGINYEGTPVNYGPDLGIEFDMNDIEQPVVDLTPSPAVSSLVVYHGEEFPNWEGDLIVASLKARTLYRFRIKDGKLEEREELMTGIARIRDVELTANGEIDLLLENPNGSVIARMASPPCEN